MAEQLQFQNFPTVINMPIIINLWPMETECSVCNKDLVDPLYSLPMYENKVVDKGDTYFMVCDECYEIHEDIQ